MNILGVQFDKRLGCDQHVPGAIQKANRALSTNQTHETFFNTFIT
jgi:hypothetical protein